MVKGRKLCCRRPENLHCDVPGNVRGGVQIVLSGALAVESDGQEITLELLHHGLEVVVAELLFVLKAIPQAD